MWEIVTVSDTNKIGNTIVACAHDYTVFQILMSVCWKLIHVMMMQIALILMVAIPAHAMWASLEMEKHAVRVV